MGKCDDSDPRPQQQKRKICMHPRIITGSPTHFSCMFMLIKIHIALSHIEVASMISFCCLGHVESNVKHITLAFSNIPHRRPPHPNSGKCHFVAIWQCGGAVYRMLVRYVSVYCTLHISNAPCVWTRRYDIIFYTLFGWCNNIRMRSGPKCQYNICILRSKSNCISFRRVCSRLSSSMFLLLLLLLFWKLYYSRTANVLNSYV